MKFVSTLRVCALIVALATFATACKKREVGITPIPRHGMTTGGPGSGNPTGPMEGAGTVGEGGVTGGNIPIVTDPREYEDMIPDRSVFAQDTVYFDFDRSSVKDAEKIKVENVASYLKSNRANKVLVEGHCDDRGTEEYNRALGEKRALSLREALVKLGINATRIRTLSYGEDKPAVPGAADEGGWSKNRRGEFVLLVPKN
jgi:peptidoglycan-associated lipoprotein